MDQATTAWLTAMTPQERNELVDEIYDLMTSGGASRTEELVQLKQIVNYVKSLITDETKRTTIGGRLSGLVQAFLDTPRDEE